MYTGQAVDDFIGKLVPLLSKGDIIIDGGNSEHQDTTRRCREMEKKGILYGAKYLIFFSSRSLKMREKYISFALLVLLSLYIF